jgi:hypothetical protein
MSVAWLGCVERVGLPAGSQGRRDAPRVTARPEDDPHAPDTALI